MSFEQAQINYEARMPSEGKYTCKECGDTYDTDQEYCDDCELVGLLTDLEDAKSPVWGYIRRLLDGEKKHKEEIEKLKSINAGLEAYAESMFQDNYTMRQE
jgi:hypothetical protein